MDNSKLISSLEMLMASAALIQEEAARIKKELQPVASKKKGGGLTDAQKAKLIGNRIKNTKRA